MMRSLLLASVTAVAMLSAPVAAQDMGESASATFDWSGPYVGVLAGYGWQDTVHCDNNTGFCLPNNPRYTDKGWLAGAAVGYNFHFANNVVLGLEGDLALAAIDGSWSNTFGFGCGGKCFSETDAIGTVRGRVGYAFDRFLPFATAGLAFDRYTAGLGDPLRAERTEWRTSAVLGGGVEYALTDRLSVKVDYLRIFNGGEMTYGECSPAGCYTSTKDTDLVRAGINLGF